MTDRAFTIRAGNMNAFECLLRVIKKIAKGYRIGQVLFKSSRADPAEHGQTGEEIIDGFFVVQVKSVSANLERREDICYKCQLGNVPVSNSVHREPQGDRGTGRISLCLSITRYISPAMAGQVIAKRKDIISN